MVGQSVGDWCGEGGTDEGGEARPYAVGVAAAQASPAVEEPPGVDECGSRSGDVDAVDAVEALDEHRTKSDGCFFIGVQGPSVGDEPGVVGDEESPNEDERRREAATSGNFTRRECCRGQASNAGQAPVVA